MVQGAIIGLIVGLVLWAVRQSKQKKGGKAVLTALSAGGPEARAALDAYVPPVAGSARAGKLLDLLERFGWLAIIGEHDALARESDALTGHVNIVTQLQAHAAVGLIAHRAEAADLERLRAAVARLEAEGGALSGVVKKQLRDLRTVAEAGPSTPLDVEAQRRVVARARKQGPAAKIVLLRFVIRAVEASGGDATPLKQEAEDASSALG